MYNGRLIEYLENSKGIKQEIIQIYLCNVGSSELCGVNYGIQL